MEHFPFFKECLKIFKYPNIHAMEPVEIADIFSNANRQFLVSWILKQIDDEYEDILENSTKEDLAEIIYCSGFCTNNQKLQFMNGECDSETQFKILYKMFKCVPDTENRDEIKSFSLTELKEFLEYDINLFQASGNFQPLNSVQRAKKTAEYLKEIEYLKTLTESKEIKDVLLLDFELKNVLLNAMENLQTNIANFKRNALDLMENKSGDGNGVEFKENFREILEMCNKEAEKVLNFIENKNVVLNFQKHQIEDFTDDNRSSRILRDICELCNDVVFASKECIELL